ncbi:MAG: two-component system response regulator [Methylococcales bacterium]|nr:two-component system response regulator [Methylococcales bacterium]
MNMEKSQKPTILVVDDTPDNLDLMGDLLMDDYRVKVANSGKKALEIIQSASPPDLVLLDIMMPEMDGYEVCTILKSSEETKNIPVIFLTAKTNTIDEQKGFEIGAVDYITKPISPAIVMARVKTHLDLHYKNVYLEKLVTQRTREIAAIQDVTIHAMASLAETRDNETGNHIRRTQNYVKLLAQHLQFHPKYTHFLNMDGVIETLFKSAPLHDIGKVGIPDAILLKPGRFEPSEFEIMKSHPELGQNTILQAESELGIDVPFLQYAKEIAYGHHEKWDGSGYPQGLSGEDIPISARLMAVADVYDALISRRVYKEGMPHEQAVQIILDGKGTHFDPHIIEAFVVLHETFKEIASTFSDSNDDMAKKQTYLQQARMA